MTIFLAELIGTGILILLGNGVVAASLLNKSKAKGESWLFMSLGPAIGVMTAAYSVGRFSGAHINPALSFAFFVIGKISVKELFIYILGQLTGAIIGQFLVYLAYKLQYDKTTDESLILATFSTSPAIRSYGYNMLTEIIATFILVFGILMMSPSFANEGSYLNYYIIGLLVLGIGISLGGPTSYAINPARDLGPRILHQILPLKNKGSSDWSYAFVPVLGPMIGGFIAAMLYIFIY